MPVHVRENLYRGVNAHLQSYLQEHGSRWVSFHNTHIVDLTRTLTNILPAGYFALSEESLQLVAMDTTRKSRSVADIGIFRSPQQPSSGDTSVITVDQPATTIALIDTTIEQKFFQAVVIYQQSDADEIVPVTRIELLSPANKPPESYHKVYEAKRDETLQGQINLIEIDYLHMQRPVLERLASYPDREPGASPYMILVSRPFPTYSQGKLDIYRFGVDVPIPRIRVPLADDDSLVVKFGDIYNQTYTSIPYYGMKLVDYAKEPIRMETYAPDDQERIRARMAASL